MAYDPLTDCKWNLTAPQGHYITLDFEIIDVSNKYLDVIYLVYWYNFLILSFLSVSPLL